MIPSFSHQMDRSIVIDAGRETVFRFFTDTARWAKWWGTGSTIDPRTGGAVFIRHPNGIEILGEVVEINPPHRIVFTYGFASGRPIAPGGSRVTISLEPRGSSTALHLRHEFSDPAVRDEHLQGWRYQLSVFANTVADEVFADAPEVVDAWFTAWAETDPRVRDDAFAEIATPDVRFRDRFSSLEGLADVSAHAGASQKFMPGVRMTRTGDVRQCQGMVLADWVASGPDGHELMRGLNVFVLGPDGRITSAGGFWNPPANP
jgi:uncharacterized protein YndB with AHSA1/START domain